MWTNLGDEQLDERAVRYYSKTNELFHYCDAEVSCQGCGVELGYDVGCGSGIAAAATTTRCAGAMEDGDVYDVLMPEMMF